MKFITVIIITALLTYAVGLYVMLPWWSFAITTMIAAVAMPQKAWKAFLSAFIAVFLLWGGLAFKIDYANQHLLSSKVAQILPLQGSYSLLIFVTAFIGALVAGGAALTGSYLRKS